MELKVWCDGIQRVVCGVSSSTTCQDVVFALAHATGQTGRFILIEKWRNNERLLAPNEQPLTVLSKWGEYANDVTFVMKRSDANNKNNTNNSNNTNCNNNSFTTSLAATTASPSAGIAGSGIGNSPSKKDYKKSLLFSSSACSSLTKSLANTNTTTVISTTTSNTSPLKSNSCLTSSHKTDSNNSTPTKTIPQQIVNNNNNEISSPPKSLSSRPRHPPPYSEAISKSAMITNANSTSSHNSQLDQSLDERNNKRRSVEPSPQTQKQRSNSQKEQLLHRDALRLVDMQKETMKNQEKDMLNLEQQIATIEKKLSENENIVKRYKEEMEVCHQLWLDQEAMIDKLDQQRLEQELDEMVAGAKSYEEEIMVMKKKLSNCEGDIADCRQKIAKLMDKLVESEKCAKLSEKDKEENDRLLTDQLKIAIREKNRDLESQKCDLQTLTNSITHLDTVLHEKNTQIDKLMIDLREANIQGLALQPADDVSKMTKQPFHQRSGSTRRIIGSPRQLENAVATNKNPHGVWV